MVKQILMYGALYDYSIMDIMTQLDDAKESDISVRVNTPGGSIYDAYGVVAKFIEFPNKKVVEVDGIAASAGAFFCCYANDVTCLDVSTFLFHRAAAPCYIECDPEYFTEDIRSCLTKVNKDLRAAMEGKFTAEKWLKVTGVSLDDLFSLDSRIDVTLNAKQAKQLGLVSKIKEITPAIKTEIETLSIKIAAVSIPVIAETKQSETIIDNSKIEIKMTPAQLQAAHPETYNAVFGLGVSAEKDRVGAFMAYIDIDPKAVAEGIKGDKAPSLTEMSEFHRKGMAKTVVAAVVEDATKPINGVVIDPKAVVTPEAKATNDFMAEAKANLGLK